MAYQKKRLECEYCRQEFYADRYDAKTCYPRCRQARKRERAKVEEGMAILKLPADEPWRMLVSDAKRLLGEMGVEH